MWPFKPTKWVVVKQQVMPSRIEELMKLGIMPETGSPSLLQKVVLVHYRDELSGNEKVDKITL